MLNFEDIRNHKEILEHFGEVRQARKAAEEMAELSSKLLAWADSKQDFDCSVGDTEFRMIEKFEEAREELADVLNILEQMKLIFGDVSGYREQKIKRTFYEYEI